jgi:hypothetical protein
MTNNTCNSSTCIHGICTSSTVCSCNSFYEGKNCDIYWGHKYHYMKYFMIPYATIVCFLQLLILVFCCWKVYEKIKRRRSGIEEPFWTISNTIFFCAAIASFCKSYNEYFLLTKWYFLLAVRILAFSALDPAGFFGWMPTWPQAVLLFIPLWMWLNLAAMLLLYW